MDNVDEVPVTTDECVIPVEVVKDIHVVVEPGWTPPFKDDAHREKWFQRWVDDLTDFFRDHRSQDVNRVYVHREIELQCSDCESKWEPVMYEADGEEPAYVGCAWCGKPCKP